MVSHKLCWMKLCELERCAPVESHVSVETQVPVRDLVLATWNVQHMCPAAKVSLELCRLDSGRHENDPEIISALEGILEHHKEDICLHGSLMHLIDDDASCMSSPGKLGLSGAGEEQAICAEPETSLLGLS